MLERIEWQTKDLKTLPFREGRALCSQRDPEREAQLWLLNEKKRWAKRLVKESPFLVLGLGAGFHVEALAKEISGQAIHVFESDVVLIEKFKSQTSISNVYFWAESEKSDLKSSLQGQYPVVASFRPCWQGAESSYIELESYFLGSKNIKQILQGEFPAEEQMLWRILGEVVK